MTCRSSQALYMNHLSATGGQPNHLEAKPKDAKLEGVYCIYTVVG